MVSASSPDRLVRLIDKIADDPSMNEGVLAMRERGRFDEATAKMVGIALDSRARQVLDDTLDEFWTHDRNAGVGMAAAGHDEVIIGGGYHAAVYARVRHMLGFPKPLVIDDGERAGGTFACSRGPSFYLNSRNRPGQLLTPGERGALNVIPGLPIQPSMLSNEEYQRNNDMAFIIRMALAMSAKVVTGAKVKQVYGSASAKRRWRVDLEDGRAVLANRVIYATGLGNPKVVQRYEPEKNTRLVTFEQFMGMMDRRFPLRGLRRVAVIGGGDSGRCALEALFGIGPAQHWSIPDLDMPEYVDWYGNVPTTCEALLGLTRTRYKRLAGLLPKQNQRNFLAPVRPVGKNVSVEPGFECAYVDGKVYDLVINCTGYAQVNPRFNGSPLESTVANVFASESGSLILGWSSSLYVGVYSIGPCKPIAFTDDEVNQGYNNAPENAVAMWRLGGRTAALAKKLGPA